MAALTQVKFAGEGIFSEGNGRISRDVVTLASGAGIVTPMRVLGQITASNKYLPWLPGASDGSQTASAILAGDQVDATSADASGLAVTRLCEVNQAELDFGSANAGQIAAAIASLGLKNIIVRAAV